MSSKQLKIKSIGFKNHVHLKTIRCDFNDSYTELIGINGAGKTTMINAIWLAVKGIALKGNDCIIGDRFQFIQNGKKSMDVEIVLIDHERDDAEIILNRHVLKNNSKLTFKAPDNYHIDSEWLESLFSVSFLSAKNFTQKNKKEQALLLGIDTNKFDKELAEQKQLFTFLGRELKAIGEIDVVEKVDPIDVKALVAEEKKLQSELDVKFKENQEHNKKLRLEYDLKRKKVQSENLKQKEDGEKFDNKISSLKGVMLLLQENDYPEMDDIRYWILGLEKQKPIIKNITFHEPKYIEEIPDRSDINDINEKIRNAYDTNHQANEYEDYLEEVKKRNDKNAEIVQNKQKQQKIIDKRIKYIQSYNLPFDGLEIDDDGGLILNNREIKEPYFSKGELEKIVIKLRATLNDDLKVVFIDDFDLLDEKNQKEIPDELIENGFQVIVAKVGRSKNSENIIALTEVEEIEENKKPKLIG